MKIMPVQKQTSAVSETDSRPLLPSVTSTGESDARAWRDWLWRERRMRCLSHWMSSESGRLGEITVTRVPKKLC